MSSQGCWHGLGPPVGQCRFRQRRSCAETSVPFLRGAGPGLIPETRGQSLPVRCRAISEKMAAEPRALSRPFHCPSAVLAVVETWLSLIGSRCCSRYLFLFGFLGFTICIEPVAPREDPFPGGLRNPSASVTKAKASRLLIAYFLSRNHPGRDKCSSCGGRRKY